FDFNRHDRLKQHCIALAHTFLESHGSRHLEGVFIGVNIMVGTIKQGNLDIHNREASKNTGRYRFAQTLFNCRNELTWNSTTLDLINEFKALARLVRLHDDPYVTILTLTTGLLDELAFNFNLLLDRFSIGN